jgi:RHS repeat-associated protein
VSYGYDYDGRRVKKTVSGTTTYYFYGETGLMSEFTTVNTGSDDADSTDRLTYHVAEQTGTPVLLMSSTGSVIENNRVFPYGELWSAETGSPNQQNFTTYLREPTAESGLDYAMARYYPSSLGRFMTADPALVGDPGDPQSWNRYAYVLNDPVLYSDPTGLIAIAPEGPPQPPPGSPIPPPGRCYDVYRDGFPEGTKCNDGGSAVNGRPFRIIPTVKPEVTADLLRLSDRETEIMRGEVPIAALGGTVYRALANRKVIYVGITTAKNFAKRQAAHAARFNIIKIKHLSSLSPFDKRAVEQVLIEFHGLGRYGGTLVNQINSIAKTNPIYQQAIQRGTEILKSIGYPGF